MKTLFKLAAGLVGIVALCGLAFYFYITSNYLLERFEPAPGLSLTCSATRFYDPMRGVHCEILDTRHGEAKARVGCFDPDESVRLQLLQANDRYYAVIEEAAPNVVLMLYDRKEALAWPHCRDDEGWKSVHVRGEQLLSQFKAASGDDKLVLRGGVPANDFQKIH